MSLSTRCLACCFCKRREVLGGPESRGEARRGREGLPFARLKTATIPQPWPWTWTWTRAEAGAGAGESLHGRD